MIQLKVCMVGSFAVGKTSLVRQYVETIFSDKYQTTVGVKVDRKDVLVGTSAVRLMIWDLAGEDAFSRLQTTFLRGAAGYLLVADGTRAHTLDVSLGLQRQIESSVGPMPFALVVNKQDLEKEWEIEPERLERLENDGMPVFRSSAKDRSGVDAIFTYLAAVNLQGRAS
jgi:small GTP-binding protein